MFRVIGEGKVEIQALPKLTFKDLLERFPIDADWEEDYKRGGWQDDAAKDIISSMEQ